MVNVVMRLTRFARRVRERLLLELDLVHWRRQTKPLRRIGRCNSGKTVLFCNLMTIVATAKVEAIFAAAMAVRGYRPVILLSQHNHLIERIFGTTVEADYLTLDSMVDGEITDRAVSAADKIMSRHQNLEDFYNLEIDGFRVGRNVQSCVVRKFRVGRLDSSNEDHREETRRILIESLSAREAAQKLFDSRRIDLAVFVEKGYTPAGEIFDACMLKGVDAIQWVGAPQSGHLLLKRFNANNRNQHPLTLSDKSWAEIKKRVWDQGLNDMVKRQIFSHYQSGAWFNRQQLQVDKTIVSNKDVKAKLGLDESKKTAVIFAHILYDATFFYGESLFDDYEQWLVETVRGAISNTNLNWVVKVHPVNVWRSRMDGVEMEQLEVSTLRHHFGELPPHVKIMPADTAINTYSLFGAVDYGLTVRGTIGMELPCFGIPVVTAGTGRYSGKGFTIDPESREAYFETLAHLHEIPRLDEETITLARKYAYGILFLRPYPTKSFEIQSDVYTYGLTSLSYNVRLDMEAIRHWPDVKDVATIADWALNGDEEDLLVNRAQ